MNCYWRARLLFNYYYVHCSANAIMSCDVLNYVSTSFWCCNKNIEKKDTHTYTHTRKGKCIASQAMSRQKPTNSTTMGYFIHREQKKTECTKHMVYNQRTNRCVTISTNTYSSIFYLLIKFHLVPHSIHVIYEYGITRIGWRIKNTECNAQTTLTCWMVSRWSFPFPSDIRFWWSFFPTPSHQSQIP